MRRHNKTPHQKFSAAKGWQFFLSTVGLCTIVLLPLILLLNIFGINFGLNFDPRNIIDSNKVITVGVLEIKSQEPKSQQSPSGYDNLVKYFNESSKLKFKLDSVVISTENALKLAKEKIEKKEWDIAFTTEPFTSIAAINEGYFFVAGMTQDAPLIQSAVIVNNNSPISKIDDINSATKLAIGDPNSVAFYYMPIYDLYGRSFTAVSQPAPFLKSAIAALKSGQVDAAVVLYGNGFKAEPLSQIITDINRGDYRVISLSRPILAGSVYISPKLEKERNFIEKLLLDAPNNIKEGAKYTTGKREEDYGFFKGLQRRVDTILDCSGKNPRTTNFYDLSIKRCKENIEGIVSSVRKVDLDKFELIVRSISTEYAVLIEQSDLLEKVSKAFAIGNVQPFDLYGNLDKINIKIVGAMPKEDTKSGTIYFDFGKNTGNTSSNDIKSLEVTRKKTA